MVSCGEMMYQNVLHVGLAGTCKMPVYRDLVLEDLFYCLYFALVFCFVLVYLFLRLDISVCGCFGSLPNLMLHNFFCLFLLTKLLVCFLFVIFFGRFCNSFYLMVLNYVVLFALQCFSFIAGFGCVFRTLPNVEWLTAKNY